MKYLTLMAGSVQIDALTRDIELPIAPLEAMQVEIVLEYLEAAWNQVKANYAAYASASDEAELNALMEAELKRLLANDGVFGLLASAISRGSETPNFNGTKIEKRPDLNIHRSDVNVPFPITVECKIVDGVDRTIKKYCDDGVSRYLDGDYGWGGRDAFMLAYVRDGSTIGAGLNPLLGTKSYATIACPKPKTTSPQIGLSQHKRAFVYPTKTPPKNQPGPITLRHLWLA